MPEASSVHDNFLLSYTVDAGERRVTLRTAFLDREPHEYTDVFFLDVFAYHFEGDTFGTVLFDIEAVELTDIYTTYGEVFRRRKRYGWPPVEYGTPEELAGALRSRGLRCYQIASSCGMDGFVIAGAVHRYSRTE